jgi:hypothetical protein
MISVDVEKKFRRLTTPRAAAVAGILFSLLFSTSLVLLRIAIPEGRSGRQPALHCADIDAFCRYRFHLVHRRDA